MKLSLLEQETVLLYNQAESAAEVYTHDPKLMKKLEKLAENTRSRSSRRTTTTSLSPNAAYRSGSRTAKSGAKPPVNGPGPQAISRR